MGSVPVIAGKRALLVRRAGPGDRAELFACRRGSRRAVALGATYGNAVSTNARARSTLVGAATGGTVVAAGFEVLVNGCLYARGCGDAPRQVLRVADTRAVTLRRIPLHGSLDAVSVGDDGRVTFRVDEYACLSDYRTDARSGAGIELLRRVPARAAQPGGTPLCAADDDLVERDIPDAPGLTREETVSSAAP